MCIRDRLRSARMVVEGQSGRALRSDQPERQVSEGSLHAGGDIAAGRAARAQVELPGYMALRDQIRLQSTVRCLVSGKTTPWRGQTDGCNTTRIRRGHE